MSYICPKPVSRNGFRQGNGINSGAPNDGFLPNALKRCFRLSGVFLKLCRLILGGAIKFVSVRSF